MSAIVQSEDQIVVKGERLFYGIGAVGTFMAIDGIREISEILPDLAPNSPADIFGLIFLSVWTLIAFGMAIGCFRMGSGRIILDNQGVHVTALFGKKHLDWDEIVDYGLSYQGISQAQNTYYLYFSKEKLPDKNECSKKRSRKMIKFVLIGDSYDAALDQILPFCALRTKVVPFVGRDRHHWM